VLPQKCHLGGNSIGQSNQWPIDQELARRQWGASTQLAAHSLSRSLAARTRTRQIDFLMCARALRWPFCVQRRRALTQRENIGLELRFVLFEPITYSLKSNLALAASAFSATPPLCIDCAE